MYHLETEVERLHSMVKAPAVTVVGHNERLSSLDHQRLNGQLHGSVSNVANELMSQRFHCLKLPQTQSICIMALCDN